MPTPTVVCPRCFMPVPAVARAWFCRRCGLRTDGAADEPAMDLTVNGRPYRVLDRVGVGSRTAVYRCAFGDRLATEGTLKLARDPAANGAIAHEAEALRHLHRCDADGTFTPFLPAVVESFGYVGNPGEPPRHANVLRLHPDVRSPADDLYTLAEVRQAYPDGLDARDMAWVWRRLLTVLGFAHLNAVAHGAVLPVHVLVDGADHKLVLIDWCAATMPNRQAVSRGPPPAPAAYRQWTAAEPLPTPAGDVRLAARCMADLLGGDAATDAYPSAVPPGIARHLSRCATVARADAWQLRAEFDQLIEALWGPRQFRPLAMPARRA